MSIERSVAPALVLALVGCVLSIADMVPREGATFDTDFLGVWQEAAGSDRVTIFQAGEGTYGLELVSGGETGRFQGRLGSLGGRTVLDVWPAPGEGDLPQTYADALVRGHLLLVLEVGPEGVWVSLLEPDTLRDRLRSGRARMDHEVGEDQLILLGTTGELRAALDSYLGQPGVLSGPELWRRVDPPDATGPVTVPCFEAAAWREADDLFHRDPHWLGGDGASSVDLGGGRILWLFGDSWIDPSGGGIRRGARMVSNSVAIQVGADPSRASIRFYWGRAPDGSPAAFIPDEGGERHWFGNGVWVGDRLVLFLNRVVGTDTGLGFESIGWTAWMVENPDVEPSAWQIAKLATPTNPLGVLVGFAAVLKADDFVYAFGSEDPVKSHPIYVVRWPAEKIRQGDLLEPEWWGGALNGWVADSSALPRWPIFEQGQSELSIHVDPVTERFLAVQTEGFGPADVMMRAAPSLVGPWSGTSLLHRPSEYSRPNVMIYSAKAHPELTGGDLVLTYDTNTFRFAEQLSDPLIYYPRFLRLTRCRRD